MKLFTLTNAATQATTTLRSELPHRQNRLDQGPEAARRDLSDQNQTGKRGPTDRHKIPDKRGENRGRCFHPKAQHRTRPNLSPPNLAQASLSLVTRAGSSPAGCKASNSNDLQTDCDPKKKTFPKYILIPSSLFAFILTS